MAEKNPFDIELPKESSNPFDVDIDIQKKNPIGNDLRGGFEPFQPKVQTKTPSVLTPKGAVEYQEQVKDYKPQPVTPIESSENIAPLMAGLQSTTSSFYKIPRYIYDVFAIPQNLIADLANIPELKANYDNVSKGALNPLSYLEYAGDYTKGKAKEWEAKQRKYDEDITTQLFKSKDFGGAALQIYDNVVASAPSIAAMFLTGGAASASKLGGVATKIATALPFASAQNEELINNQNVPDWLKPVNAAFNGLSEILLEGKFGTTAILNGATKIAAEQGVDVAVKSIKDFAYNYVKKVLSKVQPVTDVIANSMEEMATTLSQNIIAKATGEDPNRNIMAGVFDSGIVGGAQGAAATSIRKGIDVIVDRKAKKKVDELTKQRDDISKDLDNDNLPSAVKEQLESKIENITEEINNALDENRTNLESLPTETKAEIADLSDRVESIKESLQDESISETSKSILEQDLKVAQAELDAKFKIAKPTFDTEEQIIAEGQQAEADFKTTDDLVTYEQKMKELDERAKNLVPAPEAEVAQLTQEDALKDVESTAKALEGLNTNSLEAPLLAEIAGGRIEGKSAKQVISEAYHKAKAEGIENDLTKTVEELLTPKKQEDATKIREIEQGRIGEYPRTTEQQQREQEDRKDQEKPISETEAEAGGRNRIVEGGQVEEDVIPKEEFATEEEAISEPVPEIKKEDIYDKIIEKEFSKIGTLSLEKIPTEMIVESDNPRKTRSRHTEIMKNVAKLNKLIKCK